MVRAEAAGLDFRAWFIPIGLLVNSPLSPRRASFATDRISLTAALPATISGRFLIHFPKSRALTRSPTSIQRTWFAKNVASLSPIPVKRAIRCSFGLSTKSANFESSYVGSLQHDRWKIILSRTIPRDHTSAGPGR